MWIVRLALKRSYTFLVVTSLIVLLGATAIRQMTTNIFPEGDIPVITVNQIELNRVTLGRDLGARIVALDGIHGDERLIVNPSDNLASGGNVQVSQPGRPIVRSRGADVYEEFVRQHFIRPTHEDLPIGRSSR